MSLHRFYPKCVFCDLIVLRIAGQDFLLGPEFAELFDDSLPVGYCHLKCLQAASELPLLYERSRQLYPKSGWHIDYEDNEMTILTHMPADFCMILKDNGWFVNFFFRTTFDRNDDGISVNTSQEYTLYRPWGEPIPYLFDDIRNAFSRNEDFPFEAFIRAFEAESTLLNNEPLSYRMQANRIMVSRLDGDDCEMESDVDTLEPNINYSIQIPEKIWANMPNHIKQIMQQKP